MSKWKYKQATVTVGDNSQAVRQMTYEDRRQFALKSREIKDGKLQPSELPGFVLKFGCIGLAEDEIASMPPDLADACVSKIMELSGLKDDEDHGEKKDLTSPSPLPS